MTRYGIELRGTGFFECEVEADDGESAVVKAFDLLDEEFQEVDWDAEGVFELGD